MLPLCFAGLEARVFNGISAHNHFLLVRRFLQLRLLKVKFVHCYSCCCIYSTTLRRLLFRFTWATFRKQASLSMGLLSKQSHSSSQQNGWTLDIKLTTSYKTSHSKPNSSLPTAIQRRTLMLMLLAITNQHCNVYYAIYSNLFYAVPFYIYAF